MGMESVLQKYLTFVKHKLRTAYKITGLLFIMLGQHIVRKKRPYLLIVSIIEEIVKSKDIIIQVKHIQTLGLYTRFTIKIDGALDEVSGNYFKRELALQLGCELSDIDTGYESKYYYVDITNTAVNNFEKGITPYTPKAFKKDKEIIPDTKGLMN